MGFNSLVSKCVISFISFFFAVTMRNNACGNAPLTSYYFNDFGKFLFQNEILPPQKNVLNMK